MILNREKKPSYFQSCKTDIQRGVLESRQVGRMFKLVNPKRKDQASVCKDSCQFMTLVRQNIKVLL